MNCAQRRFLTIVFGSTVLACLLGICLDMVTANVAVEYFTVHHPKVLSTESAWAMALFWGVAASWWFGAIAGVIIASINHWRRQPLEPLRIVKWNAIACLVLWVVMISILLAIMAISSTIPMEKRPATFESDSRCVAVAMAHQYAYILGAIALIVIAVKTWRSAPRPAIKVEDGPR